MKTSLETAKIAVELTLWGLKCPPEVQVEHETCSTIFGTHVKAILDDEKLSGLAGGVREGKIWPRMHIPLRTGCKAVGFPALMRPPDGSRTLQNGPQMTPPPPQTVHDLHPFHGCSTYFGGLWTGSKPTILLWGDSKKDNFQSLQFC